MILLLLACAGGGTADDVCAAERSVDPNDERGWTVGTQVPYAQGEVHVEARWPDHEGPWPAALVLHGAWTPEGTPLGDGDPRTRPDQGILDVHLDLPGNGRTDGANDRRGAGSRAAVAAALQWIAGETLDLGGCSLPDRVQQEPGAIYVVGASNGGNLAAAVLADPDLVLPPIAGLVTWETPAGAQFTNVELGADPTVYEPGTCTLGTAGIACALPDLAVLAGTRDGHEVLCFDRDDSGTCGPDDVNVPGVVDLETGRTLVSPELAAAADAAGVLPDGWAGQAEAAEWWAWRDAGRLAPGIVSQHSELPVLLIASEVDHVQTLADHPHVFGFGEALQAAGARWTRLNPGRDRLPVAAGENEPNAPLTLTNPEGRLLTEAEESPLEDVLSAAVLELEDHRAAQDW